MSRLGVLSIHLDGAPCAVGCPFCYLGGRRELLALGRRSEVKAGAEAHASARPRHAADELVRAAQTFDYAELAVALSEPFDAATLQSLRRLIAAAAERQRPIAVTTTPQLVLRDPSRLRGATRLNLSVDPWKLPGDGAALLAAVTQAAEGARAEGLEVIAIATLSTPAFAEALIDGLLERLVDTPVLDGVVCNALKPPPPFCDRAFWLDALARLRPLLDRAIDRRLHLDCYVAARLLGIGGCPARPDLSPSGGKIAFRSCVYAATPDVEVEHVAELAPHLARFEPPARCPFETRL